MQQIIYAMVLLLLSPFLLLVGLSLLPVIAGIFLLWSAGNLFALLLGRKKA